MLISLNHGDLRTELALKDLVLENMLDGMVSEHGQ